MDRRRAFGWIALTATLGVGCFPDDALHTDAGGDAANDLGRDATVTDAGGLDAPRLDVPDAGPSADLGPGDGGLADGGTDGGAVVEGPACEMAPATASSRLVLSDLAGARDFAFDGRGGLAVAFGASGDAGTPATVVVRRGSDSTPLTMVMPGEVVALRYTRTAGLMIAVFNDTGAGTGSGAIYQVAPGATTATMRQAGLRRPGGLAVDANDNVWFSDTAAPVPGMPTSFGLIYRMAADADGGAAAVVVSDVRSPTHLLVDYQGRYLFAARSDTNTVMRVDLNVDGGGVGAATELVAGFSFVTGLAQDECGNVYIADDLPDLSDLVDRIWRVPILAGPVLRVVTDVRGPRALMFGVGDPFGPRELYSLSSADGTLRAANLVVRGVPLVVPAP
ncbi:MAG: hypothetical protein JWM10_3551 [Myxococcaceae bacterium]|nr:hypothetical protein [Myxococcaceae bacterium]